MEASMVRKQVPEVYPTGRCYCGCGAEIPPQSYFVSGHDKRAEGAVIRGEYGSVARFLAAHGYGPGKTDKKACTS